MSRARRGHDLETVIHRFSDDDLANLKPKQVFADKWIILKKLNKRNNSHCYQVCDKAVKNFGVLYLEQGVDNVTSIPLQVELLTKMYSNGYSHRFNQILDTGIINNSVYWMITRIRAGPTLKQLLECSENPGIISSKTASFIACDILSVIELLNSSSHVLRDFNAEQWKFDVQTRMFYLDDISDVGMSSDKRHLLIDEIHLKTARELNLSWKYTDCSSLKYAPCSFLINGSQMHQMTEFDEFEMLIYILYDLTRGELPWTHLKCQQTMLEMRRDFLTDIPNLKDLTDKKSPDYWFAMSLNNLAEHLKKAERVQDTLEKQAVRGGAWCPKGPRAPALLSIINYRRLIEDFQKIVRDGKPEYDIHWRDVALDWDKDADESQMRQIEKLELLRKSEELAEEWKRLEAIREHYEIMEEDGELEREKNRLSIDRFLKIKSGESMTPEESADIEKKLMEFKRKIELNRELKRAQKLKKTKLIQEIKMELDDPEYEGVSTSSAAPSTSSSDAYSQRLPHLPNLPEDVDDDDVEIQKDQNLPDDLKIDEKEIKQELPDDEFD
ncbi:hypothetical protein L5515_009584 [Caenorhabditis briggsae]|uniref:Protein kinase domain-containing protein n=2 Tax=Caenorhabditis briggsae TaxID=6238 RepID=A0AAE9JN82_CAEBR|nr:hypothetical protein L5515_009584 [Caenorhabditis briggsae]